MAIRNNAEILRQSVNLPLVSAGCMMKREPSSLMEVTVSRVGFFRDFRTANFHAAGIYLILHSDRLIQGGGSCHFLFAVITEKIGDYLADFLRAQFIDPRLHAFCFIR